MITTTKGMMEESCLTKRVGTDENDSSLAEWVEYWLGEELVHRSVHITIKKGGLLHFKQAELNG